MAAATPAASIAPRLFVNTIVGHRTASGESHASRIRAVPTDAARETDAIAPSTLSAASAFA